LGDPEINAYLAEIAKLYEELGRESELKEENDGTDSDVPDEPEWMRDALDHEESDPDSEIEDDPKPPEHWPRSRVERCRALHDALSAPNDPFHATAFDSEIVALWEKAIGTDLDEQNDPDGQRWDRVFRLTHNSGTFPRLRSLLQYPDRGLDRALGRASER
jgi:hypothetical protein